VRSPRVLAAILAALAVALVACTGTGEPPSVSEQTLRAIESDNTFAWQPQAAQLDLGVTHTQSTLDPDEPDEARRRGVDILADHSAIWQNVHLMGFGTTNPEPSPGDYDWSTLDQRMKLVEDTGSRTVLTACCAPDWMKGGEPGETDWDRLEAAPEPDHFGDYAKLVAATVERYPQIERVLVWNELKGFYHDEDNRWDYEGYTDLYNQIYAAVKGVRSDVEVGGPYVVLSSLDPGSPDSSDLSGPWGVADQRALDVVDYWLANNDGADFLAVDGSSSTREDSNPTSISVGAQKFADLDKWLRERSDLPIWWAEFYPDVPQGETGGPDSPASAAATLATVAAYAESGASVALLWGPQGHDLKYAALWTDSTESGGGQPTPLTAAWQWLVPRLASGDVEIGRSPRLPLLVFRAPDGAVVVNLTGDNVQVSPDTEPVPGWAVTVTDRSS
jgi:hypothetical protein